MEGETELEMVRRHVREGEGQVRRQDEVLARLQDRGAWTDMAVTLLDQFKDIQRQHEAHLARLEAGLAFDATSGHSPIEVKPHGTK